MKKIFWTLALSIFSLNAIAEDVVITTGSRGGSYFATGERLADILKEYDYSAKATKSKGSVENIQRVADGEAALGFTQLDAFAWWLSRNPNKAKQVKVLGDLFPECVYIAVNKEGPIDDEGDLETENGKIAVQKRGSGSAITWEYMRDLNKGYAKSQTIYRGGMQVLSQLASQADGEVNAFMWVSNPENLDQRYLKTVLNNENLELIDVNDWDLNDKHETLGRPIYTFEKPKVVDKFFFDKKFKTICVEAVVIANHKADDDMLDDVADILINNRTRLFPPKED